MWHVFVIHVKYLLYSAGFAAWWWPIVAETYKGLLSIKLLQLMEPWYLLIYYISHALKSMNSTFYPHNVLPFFYDFQEKNAIISLYAINRFVCVMETQGVHCEVRTGLLLFSQVSHLGGFRYEYSWILFEKLIVAQMVWRLPVFCGSRMAILSSRHRG
jgi:hypothetical protein